MSEDISTPQQPSAAKDKVFVEKQKAVRDFTFDNTVAAVFDDMVIRSVPYYDEIQRMACELAADFAMPNTRLYDIGCSTATTLVAMDQLVDPSVSFFGIDNAKDMLTKAREKVTQAGIKRNIDFALADLHQGLLIENASVITMLLTLQFVRPLYRGHIIRNLYNSLNAGGCVILVEKLTCEYSVLNRLFIEYYYNYKRRKGYSDMEITQKREALENVLIPYRFEENTELLKSAGFSYVEEFFRWYNFCGIIAIK